jgi:LDH2 family malate/lactate/ureidoglycolate dehydrogenase
VFIVIDPSKLTDSSKMIETIEATIKHIKTSAADGSGSDIAYPGEGRLKRNKENTEKGILVDDKIWAEIKAL